MRSVLRHLGQGVTPAICLCHSPRPYLLAPPVVCGCQSLGLWRMGCWPCLPQCLWLPGPLLPKVEVLPSAVRHRQPSLSPVHVYISLKYSNFLPSLSGLDLP